MRRRGFRELDELREVVERFHLDRSQLDVVAIDGTEHRREPVGGQLIDGDMFGTRCKGVTDGTQLQWNEFSLSSPRMSWP